MSFRLYIARLKCIVRNKQVMFWSYAFPLILATCYYFAFGNLYSVDSFDTISIAYDNQGVAAGDFDSALKEAKISDKTVMFDITYCSTEEAKTLLDKGDIVGYIVGSEDPKLFVKGNGLNETITKSFLDTYRQMQSAAHSILQVNPNAINEGLIDDMMQHVNFIEKLKNQKVPDSFLIYFYALLAFTCVQAAGCGLDEVVNIQADQSSCGARVNASAVRKMKLFLCNMLAAFTNHIASIIVLLLYMLCIMKVNFGNSLMLLFGVCFLGSLAGLALGATVGIWVKKKAETKEAILTAAILGGGFLSGMMVSDIKYMVADKIPFLGYINPVNLISDAMYSLYYYDTYDRYLLDVALLCSITVILGIASYVGIRRKTYASI